jgi:hypothetical protein
MNDVFDWYILISLSQVVSMTGNLLQVRNLLNNIFPFTTPWTFADRSQPQAFDLGRFRVQNYKTRLLSVSGKPDCPVNRFPEEIKEKC